MLENRFELGLATLKPDDPRLGVTRFAEEPLELVAPAGAGSAPGAISSVSASSTTRTARPWPGACSAAVFRTPRVRNLPLPWFHQPDRPDPRARGPRTGVQRAAALCATGLRQARGHPGNRRRTRRSGYAVAPASCRMALVGARRARAAADCPPLLSKCAARGG